MKTEFDLKGLSRNIVYLKALDVADLPQDLQEQADGAETIYAVHNTDGEQVALVADPAVASHLAAQHDMRLVTVH